MIKFQFSYRQHDQNYEQQANNTLFQNQLQWFYSSSVKSGYFY